MRWPLAIADGSAGLCEVQPGTEDEFKEMLQGGAIFRAKTRTTKANDVQPSQTIEQDGAAEGRNVLAEAAVALGHAVAADAEKLMKH